MMKITGYKIGVKHGFPFETDEELQTFLDKVSPLFEEVHFDGAVALLSTREQGTSIVVHGDRVEVSFLEWEDIELLLAVTTNLDRSGKPHPVLVLFVVEMQNTAGSATFNNLFSNVPPYADVEMLGFSYQEGSYKFRVGLRVADDIVKSKVSCLFEVPSLQDLKASIEHVKGLTESSVSSITMDFLRGELK